MQQFKIRPLDPSQDLSFIYSSWLRSFKSSRFARNIQPEKYYAAQHDLIESALKRSSVQLAVNHSDSNQIYGWICLEKGKDLIVHYVYIKQPYRSLGIGKSLLKEATDNNQFFFTHDTGAIQHMSNNGTYNPYPFFMEYLK